MPATLPFAQPAAVAVLDEVSLQSLRALDPDGASLLLERVLRAFATSLQRLLPQAVQALAQDDRDAVRHVVHTLKSSSASVGALELSRRCGELENRLQALSFAELEALLADLDTEGRRVLSAVLAMLAG